MTREVLETPFISSRDGFVLNFFGPGIVEYLSNHCEDVWWHMFDHYFDDTDEPSEEDFAKFVENYEFTECYIQLFQILKYEEVDRDVVLREVAKELITEEIATRAAYKSRNESNPEFLEFLELEKRYNELKKKFHYNY